MDTANIKIPNIAKLVTVRDPIFIVVEGAGKMRRSINRAMLNFGALLINWTPSVAGSVVFLPLDRQSDVVDTFVGISKMRVCMIESTRKIQVVSA